MPDLPTQLQELLGNGVNRSILEAIQRLIESSHGNYTKLQENGDYNKLENDTRRLRPQESPPGVPHTPLGVTGRLDAPDLPSRQDRENLMSDPEEYAEDFVDQFGWNALSNERDPNTGILRKDYIPSPRARPTGPTMRPDPLGDPGATVLDEDQIPRGTPYDDYKRLFNPDGVDPEKAKEEMLNRILREQLGPSEQELLEQGRGGARR